MSKSMMGSFLRYSGSIPLPHFSKDLYFSLSPSSLTCLILSTCWLWGLFYFHVCQTHIAYLGFFWHRLDSPHILWLLMVFILEGNTLLLISAVNVVHGFSLPIYLLWLLLCRGLGRSKNYASILAAIFPEFFKTFFI